MKEANQSKSFVFVKKLPLFSLDRASGCVAQLVHKENIDTSTPTGKLMFHVIAALAEFERDIIQERTLAGLEAARARDRKGGRPKATSTIRPGDLARARALYAARENTVAEIMQLTGFKNRSIFYKYVINTEKKT